MSHHVWSRDWSETYRNKTWFQVKLIEPMMEPQSSFARYPLHNGPCNLFVSFPMAPPSRTEIYMTLHCEFALKTIQNAQTYKIL